MIIKELRLTNIKSYESARFTFGQGVNGICGLNGHGKTTVLEAIGFALYNSMPYRPRSNFIRHGQKNGEVEVWFEAEDEVEVRVRRRVGDGLLEVGLPHRTLKGEDARHWLEENVHSGLGSFSEASEFFRDMVGVPQGTFTAIFLEADSARRARFDKLLHVEDYRRCHSELLGPLNLVKDRLSEIRASVASVEAKLEERPGLEKRVREDEGTVEAMGAELERMAEELSGLEKEHAEAERTRKELDELGKESAGLTAGLRQLSARIQAARADVDALHKAEMTARENLGEYEAFQGLSRERSALEGRRKKAAEASRELARTTSALEAAQASIADLERQLVELKKRGEDLGALETEALRADELRDDLSRLRARSDSLRREVEGLLARKKGVGGKNACPVFEGVTCTTVEDFSKYFKTEIGKRNAEIKETDRRAAVLEKDLKKAAGARARLEAVKADMKRLTDLAERKKEADGRIKELTKQMGKLEKTGGEEVVRSLDSEGSALAEKEKDLAPAHKSYLEASALADRLAKAPKDLERLEKEEKGAKERLSELQEKGKGLERTFDPGTFAKTSERLKALRAEHSALKAKREQIMSDLGERRTRLEGLMALSQEKEGLEAESASQGGLAAFIDFSRTALKGAAESVALRFVEEISLSASDIYSELMEDHAQTLQWDPSYAVSVDDRGAVKEYAQLSGGEQMGAAIALRLALLKGLGGSDVIFLDEPTQNMDEPRRTMLSRQIQNIRGFKQVFVITHDDSFGADYQTLIRVEKVDGISRVVGNGEVGADPGAGDVMGGADGA